MNGWMGTVLRVDLSKKEITKEPLKKELIDKYVGGRGLNSKYLYDEIKPGIAPLGPGNKLFFGVGPCNGTIVPASTRFTISAKSPLTGFIGDSNSGGSFGAGLKYAGYDMLIIEGKAESPVYLLISDDKVELKNARHLWGKTTGETRRALEKEVGDPEISVVSIGPAGENLVKFAAVVADIGRCHARTGMGAVLGSKKLKAVAVRGTKGIKVANPELLKETASRINQIFNKNPAMVQGMVVNGLLKGMDLYNTFGILPTKNYLQGTFPEIESVSGQRFGERYFFKPKSCFSCPLPCNHLYVIDRGTWAGTYGEGLELLEAEHYSSRLMISDPDFVVKASALSNEYGIDVADMSAIIGYAMECFAAGIMTIKDTGGLRVEWGDAGAALKLMELTVYRKGIGDLFAEGVKKASEQIGRGSERFAMQVKGLSISTRDVRGSKGWALGYAVAARGADHCRHIAPDGILIKGSEVDHCRDEGTDAIPISGAGPIDPVSEKGQGRLIKLWEDMRAFQNCMQMCVMIPSLEELGLMGTMTRLFNAVTGLDLSVEQGMIIGERIVNLERAFNIREGLTRKDDSLPERFSKEPIPDGPAKGQVVNLEPMLDEYYQARGWDKTSGFPTRKKLAELGIEEVADELRIK